MLCPYWEMFVSAVINAVMAGLKLGKTATVAVAMMMVIAMRTMPSKKA
jgi:hypothetical protein